jgi:hypothetical protein
MIETIPDLPPHTVGFRASGTITRADYHDLILGPVHAGLDAVDGGKLNLIGATDDDVHGIDLGALWEDTKAAGTIGLKHRSDWGRIAMVSDKEWLRKALAGFGWLTPGELRAFDADQLDAARAWIAETAGDR